MPQQRIRVWFRKGERVRYISHLDVLRFWERAIRRAGLPLAYSQGFTPHPKLAFAGPLPLGFTSEGEIVDVTLDEPVDLDDFRARIESEATEDFAVRRVEQVAPTAPPPQAQVLWSDYTVDLPGVSIDTAREAVANFLARDSLEYVDDRRERAKTFDLRAACAWLRAEPIDGGSRLEMRLQTDQTTTARPEMLVEVLLPAAEPGPIARTAIVLDDRSPAREAWRRRGQYQ